jgi:hypothetical protein
LRASFVSLSSFSFLFLAHSIFILKSVGVIQADTGCSRTVQDRKENGDENDEEEKRGR